MSGLPFCWWKMSKDGNENAPRKSPNPRTSIEHEQGFPSLPPEVTAATAALVTFLLGSTAVSSFFLYKRYGRRIGNSDWITPNHLLRKRWIKGIVTSVGDADNFRLYHTPVLGYNWPFKFRKIPTLPKDLVNETIHVRIAGVDAPEGSYFGKPGQPYAAEALRWLRAQILGKKVYCQLLRKDHYGRIVSQVYLAPTILPGSLFCGKNIGAEMLKAGWAVTYEQSGAEYGHLGKEGYLRLEKEAKSARRGMWKHGIGETPAAYKRRYAGNETAPAAQPVAKPTKARIRSKRSEWRSLFARWL